MKMGDSYPLLLSIDTSIRAMGYGLFSSTLIKCGLIRSKAELPGDAINEQLNSLNNTLSVVPDHILIELPQIYDPRRWKGDPNDLIWVSVLCGGIAGLYLQAHTEYVLPSQWKGQSSKDVVQYRVEQVLTIPELDVIERDMTPVPAYLRHNVWEAIGIGLFSLHRIHA